MSVNCSESCSRISTTSSRWQFQLGGRPLHSHEGRIPDGVHEKLPNYKENKSKLLQSKLLDRDSSKRNYFNMLKIIKKIGYQEKEESKNGTSSFSFPFNYFLCLQQPCTSLLIVQEPIKSDGLRTSLPSTDSTALQEEN